MGAFHLASDVKHPDKMSRKEKLSMISAFESEQDSVNWWLRHAARSVSKKAFNSARGY